MSVSYPELLNRYGSVGELYKAFFDEMSEDERTKVVQYLDMRHLAMFAILRALDRDSFKKLYGVEATR